MIPRTRVTTAFFALQNLTFMEAHGLKKPQVKRPQILRIDLDGDGREEVRISGTNYFTKGGRIPHRSPAGSYPFVLLRRVVGGTVQRTRIEGEFHPDGFVRTCTVTAPRGPAQEEF